ncbi:MAG: hypothetical protein MPJ83_08185 [Gammaproteobacteria bacterium]|nr:hypothetical protein [Gammaproteobacteria bacterium]
MNPSLKKYFAPATFKEYREKEMLAEFFSDRAHGVYVDVGGNRPSNAVSLQFHERGWRGVVVEPIPENAQMFRNANIPVWEGAATDSATAACGEATLHLAGGGAWHVVAGAGVHHRPHAGQAHYRESGHA